eukprot:m.51393 g.51393  ORF g.51393 m.51393 type:complete len:135 (+) comp34134_c0_seq6:223-627(+)
MFSSICLFLFCRAILSTASTMHMSVNPTPTSMPGMMNHGHGMTNGAVEPSATHAMSGHDMAHPTSGNHAGHGTDSDGMDHGAGSNAHDGGHAMFFNIDQGVSVVFEFWKLDSIGGELGLMGGSQRNAGTTYKGC